MATTQGKGATLYLRGLPRELARASKAAAAERGVTLTQFVAEALQEKLTAARTVPAGTSDPLVALQTDMEWFEANRSRLLEAYGGLYVAIVDQQVVDSDEEFARLAQRVFARFGPRPVFMPRVTPEERTVRVPSPRVVRS
ncbi:MAG: hypothetical protein IMX02_01935 [Limnochordaceae bacterium]|nr:hypothetical protein [Limnochordaceae bacterium]